MSFTGLSTEEARSRLATDGPNSLPSDSENSLWKVALSVVREPMLLLLVSAGIISFLLAELVDALLLMATVLIVLGISIFQERRTERALHALNELTAPLALVIRDGKEERISSSQVVRGDLLVLLEGDRITADGYLIESTSIEVDESLLTGESIPVIKSEGDLILTGSLVVRGHGKAEVSATGTATELGKIGKSIQDLGLIVSNLTILGAAQVAFFREYENLSYVIAVGLILISIWLYTKIGSWILAASAMTALGAGAAEFVISTMENSLAAILGMLLVGGIVTTMGIRAAGSRNG